MNCRVCNDMRRVRVVDPTVRHVPTQGQTFAYFMDCPLCCSTAHVVPSLRAQLTVARVYTWTFATSLAIFVAAFGYHVLVAH